MLQIRPSGREQTLGHVLVRDPELLRDALPCVAENGPANGLPLRLGPPLEKVVGQAENRVGGRVPFLLPRMQLCPPLRASHLIKLVQPLSRSHEGGTVFLVRVGAPADADLADS